MSGKGKGKHIGRKNKRSRYIMQESKNKARRQKRHQDAIALAQIKGMERDELLEKALTTLGTKKASLQKLIGTLNARRLRAVVENKYLTAPWFIERTARRQEIKYVRKSSKKANNDSGVPSGTNTPDGDTQVVSGN
jgi:hypothetical protein